MKYFLDLFSGIGGFHLGAQWAGLHFDGYYYSEVDPYAIKVYAKRFPDAVWLGDITKIDGHDLPQGEWIIAGGFPCQDISVAGKGAGLEGERSGLWYEYARIIGELRPRFAIMENVGALAFRGLDSVLGSLAAIGYDAEWQDIRASDVGAPHRRERIWIVAYPDCSRLEEHGMLDTMLSIGSSEAGTSTESIETDVPDAIGERIRNLSGRRDGPSRAGPAELIHDGAEGALADATSARLSIRGQPGQPESSTQAQPRLEPKFERCREALADASNGRNVRRDRELEPAQRQVREHRGSAKDGRREWWSAEPDVCGISYELS